MENRNYKVYRDNIFVGEVVRTNYIYRGENRFGNKVGLLDVGAYTPYRSILFTPTKEIMANDLLYKSPMFPVINMTDDQICLNLGENAVVVRKAFNLSAILRYYKFGKELTYEDILKIRKKFFTGRFAKDNCELFGYEELNEDDVLFLKNGKKIESSFEELMAKTEFRLDKMFGCRQFGFKGQGPLPKEYWDVLDKCGNKRVTDVILFQEKIDSFVPHKEEGPIKKLKR